MASSSLASGYHYLSHQDGDNTSRDVYWFEHNLAFGGANAVSSLGRSFMHWGLKIIGGAGNGNDLYIENANGRANGDRYPYHIMVCESRGSFFNGYDRSGYDEQYIGSTSTKNIVNFLLNEYYNGANPRYVYEQFASFANRNGNSYNPGTNDNSCGNTRNCQCLVMDVSKNLLGSHSLSQMKGTGGISGVDMGEGVGARAAGAAVGAVAAVGGAAVGAVTDPIGTVSNIGGNIGSALGGWF